MPGRVDWREGRLGCVSKSAEISLFDATQCSEWASLVAQLVKNTPAMQETPVQFLGGENTLENG